MPPDLDPLLLRAFVAAVRAGSLSRAASALGRTQPVLSQQVRRLEDIIGQPLLRRSPTGVTLTQAGEALLPYAERILALSREALDAAARRPRVAGRCGIGLLEDLAVASLSQALADFERVHPGVVLEVVTGSGPAMREALDAGRIDVALCDTTYLRQEPRWSALLPLTWAVGPHFDTTADPLPVVLFAQPCRWRQPVLDALAGAQRRARVVFESSGLAGILSAVRAGIGAAALLRANIGSDLCAAGDASGLPRLSEVTLGFVRRLGSEGNPLLDALEPVLRQLVCGAAGAKFVAGGARAV